MFVALLFGDLLNWTSVRLGLVILVLMGICFWFALQRKHRMSILKRNNIPGPEPHWLFGNLNEYLATPNVLWDSMLLEKYGPVCGYYLGAKPVVLISDPCLIDTIQKKEGDNFLDRPRRVPGGINPDPNRAKMLGNLKVHEWKTLRGILDKGFSPKNLKAMFPDIQKLISTFLSQLTPDAEQIDFYNLYQNLTLDLIGKTGFGVDSNIQENPNEALKAAVEQEFAKSTGTLLLKIYLCCPEIQWVLQKVRVAWESVKNYFDLGGHSELWKLSGETVRGRRGKKDRSADLLQVMIDSGKLGETEIVANSVLFFEAGFETLSASMAFITQLLMNHPHMQDNLRNEIREVMEEAEGKLQSVDKLKQLKILDSVIKEGLRMYPPQTTFIGRSGTKDVVHDFIWQGAHRQCVIPQNVHIQVCLYQILNSEDIWESPRDFRPQRFMTEAGLNKMQRTAFQPFGGGKRICIGRKYADAVLKMLFLELLSKYRLAPARTHPGKDPSSSTNVDGEIDVVYKTATMTPKSGVLGSVKNDPLF